MSISPSSSPNHSNSSNLSVFSDNISSSNSSSSKNSSLSQSYLSPPSSSLSPSSFVYYSLPIPFFGAILGILTDNQFEFSFVFWLIGCFLFLFFWLLLAQKRFFLTYIQILTSIPIIKFFKEKFISFFCLNNIFKKNVSTVDNTKTDILKTSPRSFLSKLKIRQYFPDVKAVLIFLAFFALFGGWHSLHSRYYRADEIGRFAAEEKKPIILIVRLLRSPEIYQSADHLMFRSNSDKNALPQNSLFQDDPQTKLTTFFQAEALSVFNQGTWMPVSGKIAVSVDGNASQYQIGDHIRLQGTFHRTFSAKNPDEWDQKKQLQRDRILTQVRVPQPDCCQKLTEDSFSFYRFFESLRTSADHIFQEHLSKDSAAFASAMILGKRTAINTETKEEFQETGTVHLLAISGLHIGLFAGFFYLILKKITSSHKLLALELAGLTLFYLFLTDMRPSAVRASILVLVAALGLFWDRKPISLNGFCLAGLTVLTLNPQDLFQVGAQLSFLATAVFLWFPKESSARKKKTSIASKLPKQTFQDILRNSFLFSFIPFSLLHRDFISQTAAPEKTNSESRQTKPEQINSKQSVLQTINSEPSNSQHSNFETSNSQYLNLKPSNSQQNKNKSIADIERTELNHPKSEPAHSELILSNNEISPSKKMQTRLPNDFISFKTGAILFLLLIFIKNRVLNLFSFLYRVFKVSFLVWLVMIPVVLNLFHLLTVIAILVNPLIWIPMILGLVFGFSLMFSAWLCPFLIPLTSFLTDISFYSMKMILSSVHSLSLGCYWLPGPPRYWCLLFYFFFFLWTLFPNFRPNKIKITLWIAAAVLVEIGITLLEKEICIQKNQLSVEILSVGHGAAFLLSFPDGRTALLDAGSFSSPETAAKTIANGIWRKNRTSVDLLIISHSDSDHYNAVEYLLDFCSVRQVVISPYMFEKQNSLINRLEQRLNKEKIPVSYVLHGDSLAAYGFPELRILHPDPPTPEYMFNDELKTNINEKNEINRSLQNKTTKNQTSQNLSEQNLSIKNSWTQNKSEQIPSIQNLTAKEIQELAADSNAQSLVVLLEYLGRRILFPGDLDSQNASFLEESPTDCDLILSPHHGGKSSNDKELLQWATPEIIVISGGSFLHNPKLIEELRAKNYLVFNTFEQGRIQILIEKSSSQIFSFKHSFSEQNRSGQDVLLQKSEHSSCKKVLANQKNSQKGRLKINIWNKI